MLHVLLARGAERQSEEPVSVLLHELLLRCLLPERTAGELLPLARARGVAEERTIVPGAMRTFAWAINSHSSITSSCVDFLPYSRCSETCTRSHTNIPPCGATNDRSVLSALFSDLENPFSSRARVRSSKRPEEEERESRPA